jgi:hypothetical protein
VEDPYAKSGTVEQATEGNLVVLKYDSSANQEAADSLSSLLRGKGAYDSARTHGASHCPASRRSRLSELAGAACGRRNASKTIAITLRT